MIAAGSSQPCAVPCACRADTASAIRNADRTASTEVFRMICCRSSLRLSPRGCSAIKTPPVGVAITSITRARWAWVADRARSKRECLRSSARESIRTIVLFVGSENARRDRSPATASPPRTGKQLASPVQVRWETALPLPTLFVEARTFVVRGPAGPRRSQSGTPASRLGNDGSACPQRSGRKNV